MSQITTAGEMRQFLANMMMGVKEGSIKIAEAIAIKKMAEEINESLYAEVKVSRLQIDLSRPVPATGDLPIGKKK